MGSLHFTVHPAYMSMTCTHITLSRAHAPPTITHRDPTMCPLQGQHPWALMITVTISKRSPSLEIFQVARMGVGRRKAHGRYSKGTQDYCAVVGMGEGGG